MNKAERHQDVSGGGAKMVVKGHKNGGEEGRQNGGEGGRQNGGGGGRENGAEEGVI